MTTAQSIRTVSYELEIPISAPRGRVWKAMIGDINAWWLPDFHMVGEGSHVTFDTRAGGGIIEHLEEGGSLLWYTVHWCRQDQYTIYLVGHVAPDWGGPATSHLKLDLEGLNGDTQSVLRVTDTLLGCVSDESASSLKAGWSQLFSDGLKAFVEKRALPGD